MAHARVDLGSAELWGFVLLAVLLVQPVVQAGLRVALLALLDLGFIAWLLGPKRALSALLLAALLYAVARLLHQREARGAALRAVLSAAGLGLLALFALHKLPQVPAALGSARGALAALGFSYAALRAVELLRAAWERRGAPPSLLEVLHYLWPFHMLSAGPILSWDEHLAAPKVPARLDLDQVIAAVERITQGLVKKFVLAYAVERALLTGFTAGGPYLLLEVQAYYLWVYLDFSAYSDVAVGIGRLLGTPTPENFNRPLLAASVIDFWERWHISLSQLIRRQIFIPLQLGLMRRTDGARPLLSASVALGVSFVLCGLWHGLSLRFLIWGAGHALAVVLTNAYRYWLKQRLGAAGLKRYRSRASIRVVATILTFELVAWSLWWVAPSAGAG